jgi:hypothetical protein
LDGIATFKEDGNGKISEEEFLRLWFICWIPTRLFGQP